MVQSLAFLNCVLGLVLGLVFLSSRLLDAALGGAAASQAADANPSSNQFFVVTYTTHRTLENAPPSLAE